MPCRCFVVCSPDTAHHAGNTPPPPPPRPLPSAAQRKLEAVTFNTAVRDQRQDMIELLHGQLSTTRRALEREQGENRALHLALKRLKEHVLQQGGGGGVGPAAAIPAGHGSDASPHHPSYAEALASLRAEVRAKEARITSLEGALAAAQTQRAHILAAWNEQQLSQQQRVGRTPTAVGGLVGARPLMGPRTLALPASGKRVLDSGPVDSKASSATPLTTADPAGAARPPRPSRAPCTS